MSASLEGKRDTTSPGNPPTGFVRLAEGEYHARLTACAGLAVVLFSSPHCGACRGWKRLLPDALLDQARTFYEVDVSEATGVARYFGIFHLPTIYLYRYGVFHAELQCEAKADRVRQTVYDLLQAPAQEEPE
ncbi:MAG: thioredoxin family protein [Sulfuriferula multivorans]|uniref:Thioredoxin family protein n=1 Tax=Sulfuriferula multivorans TaxID=1559896 RepID=A0A7C9K0M8_9PROT|nr:thioredoxin family protein [Sulfuriferula multivorans]